MLDTKRPCSVSFDSGENGDYHGTCRCGDTFTANSLNGVLAAARQHEKEWTFARERDIDPAATYAGLISDGGMWQQFTVCAGKDALTMLANSNKPSALLFEKLAGTR